MFRYTHTFQFRSVAAFVLAAFLALIPAQSGYAQIAMPAPGQRIQPTATFEPAMMLGLQVDVKNPFNFNFIMDKGASDMPDDLQKQEYQSLIKYFLASLTIANKDMWVNLSPFESNRIIPDNFALTAMGRDLLVQDYILKQFTSSLMYPEGEVGKAFWSKLYQQAYDMFGTTDVPLDTFNKVWITADKADVYQKDNTVLLVDSHLKVMLEEDLVALEQNKDQFGNIAQREAAEPDASRKIAVAMVREVIIPVIEKEVNEGATFSKVRQIYNAMILATWFKKTLKDSLLGQAYADKDKVAGIEVNDPQARQKVYEQYLEAYKVGVFNYIKEEVDPVSNELIPRKYFSGGMDIAKVQINEVDEKRAHQGKLFQGIAAKVRKAGFIFVLATSFLLTSPSGNIFAQGNAAAPGAQIEKVDHAEQKPWGVQKAEVAAQEKEIANRKFEKAKELLDIMVSPEGKAMYETRWFERLRRSYWDGKLDVAKEFIGKQDFPAAWKILDEMAGYPYGGAEERAYPNDVFNILLNAYSRAKIEPVAALIRTQQLAQARQLLDGLDQDKYLKLGKINAFNWLLNDYLLAKLGTLLPLEAGGKEGEIQQVLNEVVPFLVDKRVGQRVIQSIKFYNVRHGDAEEKKEPGASGLAMGKETDKAQMIFVINETHVGSAQELLDLYQRNLEQGKSTYIYHEEFYFCEVVNINNERQLFQVKALNGVLPIAAYSKKVHAWSELSSSKAGKTFSLSLKQLQKVFLVPDEFTAKPALASSLKEQTIVVNDLIDKLNGKNGNDTEKALEAAREFLVTTWPLVGDTYSQTMFDEVKRAYLNRQSVRVRTFIDEQSFEKARAILNEMDSDEAGHYPYGDGGLIRSIFPKLVSAYWESKRGVAESFINNQEFDKAREVIEDLSGDRYIDKGKGQAFGALLNTFFVEKLKVVRAVLNNLFEEEEPDLKEVKQTLDDIANDPLFKNKRVTEETRKFSEFVEDQHDFLAFVRGYSDKWIMDDKLYTSQEYFEAWKTMFEDWESRGDQNQEEAFVKASTVTEEHYRILGLDPALPLTKSELRTAYRRAAALHHPDKNPDDLNAKDMMQKINAANDALMGVLVKEGDDSEKTGAGQTSSQQDKAQLVVDIPSVPIASAEMLLSLYNSNKAEGNPTYIFHESFKFCEVVGMGVDGDGMTVDLKRTADLSVSSQSRKQYNAKDQVPMEIGEIHTISLSKQLYKNIYFVQEEEVEAPEETQTVDSPKAVPALAYSLPIDQKFSEARAFIAQGLYTQAYDAMTQAFKLILFLSEKNVDANGNPIDARINDVGLLKEVVDALAKGMREGRADLPSTSLIVKTLKDLKKEQFNEAIGKLINERLKGLNREIIKFQGNKWNLPQAQIDKKNEEILQDIKDEFEAKGPVYILHGEFGLCRVLESDEESGFIKIKVLGPVAVDGEVAYESRRRQSDVIESEKKEYNQTLSFDLKKNKYKVTLWKTAEGRAFMKARAEAFMSPEAVKAVFTAKIDPEKARKLFKERGRDRVREYILKLSEFKEGKKISTWPGYSTAGTKSLSLMHRSLQLGLPALTEVPADIDFYYRTWLYRMGVDIFEADGRGVRRDSPFEYAIGNYYNKNGKPNALTAAILDQLNGAPNIANVRKFLKTYQSQIDAKLAPVLPKVDMIMPVPRSDGTAGTPALIAQEFGQRYSKRVLQDALEKKEKFEQKKVRTLYHRLRNAAGAYAIREGAEYRVRGKTVLLVDDIQITGTTFEAIAAVLYKAGARVVIRFSLADGNSNIIDNDSDYIGEDLDPDFFEAANGNDPSDFIADFGKTDRGQSALGGIDLGDDHLTIGIKVDDSGTPLAMQLQDAAMQDIRGLDPVIRTIEPLTMQNMPALASLFAGAAAP